MTLMNVVLGIYSRFHSSVEKKWMERERRDHMLERYSLNNNNNNKDNFQKSQVIISFLASHPNSIYLVTFLDKDYQSCNVFKHHITNTFFMKVVEGRVNARATEEGEGQHHIFEKS